MYLKLTRIDGRPIWLNASFIVTIEPMQNGGAIVVPIGDGLDYEVRESPDAVLAMLEGAPPATVVPVPPPKSLAPTPKDVTPEDSVTGGKMERKLDTPKKTVKTTAKTKKTSTAAAGKKKTKSEESESHSETHDEKPASVAASAAEPVSAGLSDDDIERIAEKLLSHKCRTEKRLRNFIKSSYKTFDETQISEVIEAMKLRGYFIVEDGGHVTWREAST